MDKKTFFKTIKNNLEKNEKIILNSRGMERYGMSHLAVNIWKNLEIQK